MAAPPTWDWDDLALLDDDEPPETWRDTEDLPDISDYQEQQ